MDISTFVSWQTLATYGGAAAATALLVQFTKGWFDKLVHIPTQLFSYLVALVILYASSFFTGQLTGSMAALIPLNAVLVAVASNGAFSVAKTVQGAKQMQDWEQVGRADSQSGVGSQEGSGLISSNPEDLLQKSDDSQDGENKGAK